ncbi:16S rRNA (cytosine1402-N4)-methyltransferase [Bifidobacterium bohemicum]|uniref:Ribosomal RNA small subunit methyltransferase H n=1 Tax=Bifidobacterium bohemicum DSM 22767 TaxID=1437606 RepID=A0A086ZGF9_9BIFI|nr:16S rRNA (cytosine(1402)-N(4))-methyltransferase RsmH [Bifidobacterium bohemicum]KFI45609.1 S-adenosyl-methyltransferase MraW [Bifidobacterium bohemicum DSM 22767]SCC00724.1 16S rRNA (cytosine1402-N4)-methyltransferase [Bifidobacterium bohemicum]
MADSFDFTTIHKPVLLDECVALVAPALDAPNSVVVDCTLGLAGHATAFLKAAPNAHLIGIDRDSEALAMASERIQQAGLSSRFTPAHAAFDGFDEVLERNGIEQIDVAFMDLGLSSLQIDEVDRGFSYSHDAPLDMRMDVSQELDAAMVLSQYGEDDLVRIFREYGQERFARPIARAIVRRRVVEPITTSGQLDRLVDQVVPKSHRGKGNPAKRIFQALRIEVNGELDKLAATLPQIVNRLKPGGRLVVESYHSLEDRTVKTFMAQGLKVDAPADLPVVPKDAEPFLKDLTHGAVKADEAEITHNPRSASVRLRAVELVRPVPERWRTRFKASSDSAVARKERLGRLNRMEHANYVGGNPGTMRRDDMRATSARRQRESRQ